MKVVRHIIAILGVVIYSLSGCNNLVENSYVTSPSLGITQPLPASPESTSHEFNTPDKLQAITTKMPQRVPPTEMEGKVVGEVPPELLDKIVADLVERTGGESEQLLVIQAQATTWNDGSLGCPLPGVTYTQALVDGYWIVLEVEGTNYDYRAAESGFFFLCENDFPPALPPGTPNS